MPSSSDKLDLSRTNSSLNSVGSFWSEHLANRDQAFSLIEACYKVKLFNQLDTGLKQLLNEQDFLITDVFMDFKREDVIYTGDKESDEGYKADFSYNEQLLDKLDEGTQRLWLVPLSKIAVSTGLEPNAKRLVMPLKIMSEEAGRKGRQLILNSDFYVENGYIQFNEKPEILFPKNRILISLAHIDNPSIYRFPLNNHRLRNNKHIVNFCRNSQSPIHFALAIASIAGLKILSSKQKLLHSNQSLNKTHYTFEKEVVTVDYDHEPLVVGNVYNKDHIIGEGVKVYTPHKRVARWWREIDFTGGLLLSEITGHNGVLIPDDIVMAYIADTEEGTVNGDKAHVRLELIGDPDNQDRYWKEVAAKENKLNQYFNELVGIGHDGNDDINFEDENFSGIFDRLEKLYENINNYNNARSIKPEKRNVKRLRDNVELIDPVNPDATPGIKFVHALDLFFESILSTTAIVVVVDKSQVKNYVDLVKFINEQKPGGCTPIILVNMPGEEDSFDLSSTVSEAYQVFEIVDAGQGADTITMSSIIVDSYTYTLNT